MVETVKALTPTVSVRAACKVVGLPRATYYRSQRANPSSTKFGRLYAYIATFG